MISTLYEPFRHWSEGGSVCILSDLHFDDLDCKLMDPSWITPKEQIAIINKHVIYNVSAKNNSGASLKEEYIRQLTRLPRILKLVKNMMKQK